MFSWHNLPFKHQNFVHQSSYMVLKTNHLLCLHGIPTLNLRNHSRRTLHVSGKHAFCEHTSLSDELGLKVGESHEREDSGGFFLHSSTHWCQAATCTGETARFWSKNKKRSVGMLHRTGIARSRSTKLLETTRSWTNEWIPRTNLSQRSGSRSRSYKT